MAGTLPLTDARNHVAKKLEPPRRQAVYEQCRFALRVQRR
jgi:hypothetical protein